MCSTNSSRVGGGPSKITIAPTCMCEASRSWCEERGVDRAQPVLVALRHGRNPNLRVRMRGDRVLVQSLGGAAVRCRSARLRRRRRRRRRPSALPRAKVDRFDATRRLRARCKRQVELGPRPAGLAPPSRKLGERIRRALPARALPGGARRAAQRGRHGARARPEPRRGGRRALRHQGHPRLRRRQRRRRRARPSLTQLARTLKPRRLRPTLVFIAVRRRGEPARHARRRVRALRAARQQGDRARLPATPRR